MSKTPYLALTSYIPCLPSSFPWHYNSARSLKTKIPIKYAFLLSTEKDDLLVKKQKNNGASFDQPDDRGFHFQWYDSLCAFKQKITWSQLISSELFMLK